MKNRRRVVGDNMLPHWIRVLGPANRLDRSTFSPRALDWGLASQVQAHGSLASVIASEKSRRVEENVFFSTQLFVSFKAKLEMVGARAFVIVASLAFASCSSAQTFRRTGACPTLGCIFPPVSTAPAQRTVAC